MVTYLRDHFDILDEDSKRRLERNPLRVLDSKNPELQDMIRKAPQLVDALEGSSRDHFYSLCKGLDALKIPYTINPFLVRGLDYYGHTVFEWVTDKLGSQATVCAGGRYDALVAQLGGSATPAVGFALGMERILLLMATLGLTQPEVQKLSLFVIATHDEAMVQGLVLAESIRDNYPSVDVSVNTAGGSLKSQFKKADKSGARFALILGDDECVNQQVSIKDLRSDVEQVTMAQSNINDFLQDYLR